MPIAATGWSRSAVSSRSTSVTADQISSASCSTQPGRGKYCGNSRYDQPAGVPYSSTANARTPVVPASIAMITLTGAHPMRLRRQVLQWPERPAADGGQERDAERRVLAARLEGTMRVGMLTGGGDCPGLNAVLRAAVRKGQSHYEDELVGFRDGWKGVIEDRADELDIERMRGTLPRGGTVLGSSRTNPYKVDGGVERVKETLAKNDVDAL